jgi:hypothetical protein
MNESLFASFSSEKEGPFPRAEADLIDGRLLL